MKIHIPVLLLVLALGCGQEEGHNDHDHDGHDHVDGENEEASALDFEGLGPEDIELAKAQQFCPVSGEILGSSSMGPPVKIEGAGQTVFLCCDGCIKKFKANPEKYIAKLKEKKLK